MTRRVTAYTGFTTFALAPPVWQHADHGNDVLVTHDFPTTDQAAAFADDPELKDGMATAGVAGPRQIEIFTVA